MPKPPSPEEEKEDLKDVLVAFWLSTIRGESVDVEFPERMKASELLAKYILGSGRTQVPKPLAGRPSTQEVLRLAEEMANEDLP